MTSTATREPLDPLVAEISRLIGQEDLPAISRIVRDTSSDDLAEVMRRLPTAPSAVVFRLLAKDDALTVFEGLAPAVQGDLLRALQDSEVASVFADLDPDDRVWLLDELPATLAPRLLRGLPADERRLTAIVLGYPADSIGRRMSPEFVSVHPGTSAEEALTRVRSRAQDAETVYTLPVLDGHRRVVGVVGLREVIAADAATPVSEFMADAHLLRADDEAEAAARRCAGLRMLAMPVVDREERLVGILTIDDAMRILEREENEDAARQGGAEPLHRPYLTTPVRRIVRSRIVWLFVLAIGATLTVQVLEVFEATLNKVSVLALFVPLLIGTGGNTGNQAATTVTRALSLGEVRPRDLGRVLLREVRVGLLLGALLGLVGGVVAGLVYGPSIGLVIGLTLVALCTVAASIGGSMPIIARALHVDPAVFSNPFISTFVDATGLIIYFLVAIWVLNIPF